MIEVKKAYMVMALKEVAQIDLLGKTYDIPMSYANGMVGTMPVFMNEADAIEYSGGTYQIIPIEMGFERHGLC